MFEEKIIQIFLDQQEKLLGKKIFDNEEDAGEF